MIQIGDTSYSLDDPIVIAAAIGAFSAVTGLRAAYMFDTPAGPSIVCVAAILFACLSVVGLQTRDRSKLN